MGKWISRIVLWQV